MPIGVAAGDQYVEDGNVYQYVQIKGHAEIKNPRQKGEVIFYDDLETKKEGDMAKRGAVIKFEIVINEWLTITVSQDVEGDVMLYQSTASSQRSFAEGSDMDKDFGGIKHLLDDKLNVRYEDVLKALKKMGALVTKTERMIRDRNKKK